MNSFSKDLQTFETTEDTVLDVDWQLVAARGRFIRGLKCSCFLFY